MKVMTAVVLCLLLFEGQQAGALDVVGGYEFTVRVANPAELPKDSSGEFLEFFAPGMAFGVLGFAAPPMYASGLVVGGLLLGPGALIVSNIEHGIWQRVVDALVSIEFDKDILRALQRRAASSLPSGTGATVRVELVINGYGIVGARQDRVCFITDAALRVMTGQQEGLRRRISISDVSPNASPAQCASIDRFAERDGQLVRETAAEYAELLAALVIEQLASARNP